MPRTKPRAKPAPRAMKPLQPGLYSWDGKIWELSLPQAAQPTPTQKDWAQLTTSAWWPVVRPLLHNSGSTDFTLAKGLIQALTKAYRSGEYSGVGKAVGSLIKLRDYMARG